jgi:hypothetical protein
MPKPQHVPTDHQRKTVEAMAGYGIKHEDIARLIGITAKTLRLRYRDELDLGEVKANSRVGESLFTQAVGAPAVYDANGNMVRAEQPRVTSAGIWWSKARMGWKETQVNENTGLNGAPQEHKHTVEMSDEARELLSEVRKSLAG